MGIQDKAFKEWFAQYENNIEYASEKIAWDAWQAAKAQADQKIKLLLCDEHLKKCESPTGVFNSQYPDEEPCLICLAKETKAQAVPDLGELQERIAGHQYYHDEHGRMIVDMDDVVKEISGFDSWKAQAVPEVAQRQGGYYIRDLRSQPGNCMKFWYQAGYGTKHKNFFWCATLEEAQKYKGDCDWFEIWHAPYIDSLVEYTVDFQLADRGVGLVDLKAQEPAND